MGWTKSVGLSGQYHHSVIARLLLLVVILVSLTGCGNSNTSAPPLLTDNTQAPSLAELSDQLMEELARLGKDVNKTVAAAPTGPGNAVFDLSANIVEDSSIELSWTERIVGDYDQNGEVNLADLAPLAINFSKIVNYDDPTLHGGFAGWPVGDPDGAGADSLNWRMARIDGDSKGEIGMSDISQIAIHFQERIDGYRVYRKTPGDAGFSMLPPPAPVEVDVTLAHPASLSNTAPVRYSLSDNEATPGGLGDGVYQYYVASYDKTSGAESPASGVVHVDIVAGTINQSPVAQLSITPGFAGAPAEITLDASGSYDPDGTVAAYEWDFDTDGVVDWLSTDPVPDESSSGIVDSIIEVSQGVVTARYFEGSADWYYPTVVAVDDEALESIEATEQLGISGWLSTILKESDEDYRVRFEPQFISVDPGNGDVVIVSARGDSDFPETTGWGINFARETAEGPWPVETIEVPEVEHQDDGPSYGVLLKGIAWDEQGQPIILFDRTEKYPLQSSLATIWYAQRRLDGTWQVEMLFDTSHPEGDSTGKGFLDFVQKDDGTIIARISEGLTDKPSLSGVPWHTKYHIVTYSNGTWTVHESVVDDAETSWRPGRPVVLLNDDVYFMLIKPKDVRDEIWWSKWDDENGLLERERIDDGSISLFAGVRSIAASEDGSLHILYERAAENFSWWMVTIDDLGTSIERMEETDSDYSIKAFSPQFFHADGTEFSYILQHVAPSPYINHHYVEYIIQSYPQNNRESILSHPQFTSVNVALRDAEYPKNQIPHCLVEHPRLNGEPGSVYRVCRRVDPSK